MVLLSDTKVRVGVLMAMEAVGMGVRGSSLSLSPDLPNWCQLPTSEDLSARIFQVFCSLFLFKVVSRINKI